MEHVEEFITVTSTQLWSAKVEINLSVGHTSNVGEDVLEQTV